MSAAIYADREVSAADRAWWAMNVPCRHRACQVPATWLRLSPCPCRKTYCDEHKAWFVAHPKPNWHCPRHGGVWPKTRTTWRRL